MRRIFLFCVTVLALGFIVLRGMPAQVASSSPIFKLLYTFQTAGEPYGLVEVQPGRFFGVVQLSQGIFSILSTGNYKYLYGFPPINTGLAVYGLTPALNGQSYGSASGLGTMPTFSELFSITLRDRVSSYPYNAATQGGPINLEVQSPDGYMYSLYGVEGGPLSFERLDYKGNATKLYTFSPSQGQPASVLFQGADGAFYCLTLMNNTAEAGIFRITSTGAFSWVIPSFPTGGVHFNVSLIQASNGNFYGTLPQGGSAGTEASTRSLPQAR